MTNIVKLVKKSEGYVKPVNLEREQRILDAAVELFVRYGYDKTSVDDIAREAGVSKGAIYLHFASKDNLFEHLLLRELASYTETWLDLLDADPDGGTMAGMFKNMLYALNSNRFISALFRQDRRVFGTYLRKPDNFFRTSQAGRAQSTRHEFIQLMQEAGAVRQDIDPKVTAHIMNMLAYGLVSMDDIMPPEDIPDVEDTIEGIADMMVRALSPEDGDRSEAGKAIVRQLLDSSREQLEQMRRSRREV